MVAKLRDNLPPGTDVKLEDMFDPKLTESADSIKCIYGQVRQYNSVANLDGYYDNVIVAEAGGKTTLGDYID